MKRYTSIKGPKTTTADYLQTLKDEDLQSTYSSLFLYGLKMPQLIKKMQDELQRRNMVTQLALF